MGNFTIFVIIVTVFTLFVGAGLVFMEMFRRVYKEAEESVTTDSHYYELTDLSTK